MMLRRRYLGPLRPVLRLFSAERDLPRGGRKPAAWERVINRFTRPSISPVLVEASRCPSAEHGGRTGGTELSTVSATATSLLFRVRGVDRAT
jgi:hypothetical protein